MKTMNSKVNLLRVAVLFMSIASVTAYVAAERPVDGDNERTRRGIGWRNAPRERFTGFAGLDNLDYILSTLEKTPPPPVIATLDPARELLIAYMRKYG